MTYYVVKVGNEYIADGKPYMVQSEVFVPFTSSFKNARKYKTYAAAKKASQRRGENMWGDIHILESEDKAEWQA